MLVSADHPLRPALWRGLGFWNREMTKETRDRSAPYVPFLLKMPGQTTELSLREKFDTIISQELLWKLLNQQLTTASEVATWLNRHSS